MGDSWGSITFGKATGWVMASRRIVAAVGVVVLVMLTAVGTASAGTPAVRGCVGSTFSQNVQADVSKGTPPGSDVKVFAQSPVGRPGLGDAIQYLEAGVVPQKVVPNTCNV